MALHGYEHKYISFCSIACRYYVTGVDFCWLPGVMSNSERVGMIFESQPAPQSGTLVSFMWHLHVGLQMYIANWWLLCVSPSCMGIEVCRLP